MSNPIPKLIYFTSYRAVRKIESESVHVPRFRVAFSQIRLDGLIPGIFYGANKDNKVVSMDYQDFRRVFTKAGSHSIVEINIDGKEKHPTIIHDVQYDPVTDSYTHVDFLVVRMDKEITAEVPITFVGEAPAVKDLGGTLMTNRDVVEVKCLPKDLPSGFEVDVSVLEDYQSYEGQNY